jgi:hypothetical protein
MIIIGIIGLIYLLILHLVLIHLTVYPTTNPNSKAAKIPPPLLGNKSDIILVGSPVLMLLASYNGLLTVDVNGPHFHHIAGVVPALVSTNAGAIAERPAIEFAM